MPDPRHDPTVSWMAMDIVGQLLERTGDPADLARFLVCQLRVLTGARCAALVECRRSGHVLVDVEPARRRDIADEPAFERLMCLSHELGEAVFTNLHDDEGPIALALREMRCGVSMIIPLCIGERRLGAILALDLPAVERMQALLETFDVLAKVVALALSDAMLIRHQGERLLTSEASFQALTENMPDIISRYDRDGRLLYVNGGIIKTTGRPPEHFIGKRHVELGYSPEDVAFWERAIEQVFASGRPFETEFEISGPHGTFLLDWRLMPERDAEGTVVSVLGVARDITRERRAEQNYRMLFQSMLDGFALHEIICNEAGEPVDYRFLVVNPAFERLTGLRVEDIIGRRMLEILPDTEPYWVDTYGQVALTGEPARFDRYAEAFGKHFQVMAYRPSPGRFATIFQDVTLAKELEQHQQQAAKMEALGNLAGGIAHDFNNILQAILGYGHLARRDAAAGSRQQEAIDAIVESGERAAALVRQILTFSRQDEQSAQMLRLQDVLQEVQRLLRSTVPTTIEIVTDIDAGCPTILADPTAIHQVILNLATNGVQAMKGTTGRLELELAQCHCRLPPAVEACDCVELRVRDYGYGMEESVRKRIFDPFFTTKAQGEGTGMGLAVVHGIVSRYGGEIEVESAPGAGSCFRVRFPICRIGAVPDAADEASGAHPTVPGRGHVLFVDDEDLLCELAGEFLEEAGLSVASCDDPHEALRRLEDEPTGFDIVVSDQNMPGMSGLELAGRVKQLRADLPVILCTGFSEELDGDPRQLGFDHLLHKPYEMDELVKVVSGWLQRGCC